MKKFLLHTCCAPCGIAVVDELRAKFDLTVFFYNPNIYPEEEYLKRKAEVIKVCQKWNVQMIDGDYEPDFWLAAVGGLEKEREGGARCPVCFRMRFEKTAALAAQLGFDIFGTTLSMGRSKSAAVLNPIGKEVGAKYGLEFFEADWKKDGRQERAHIMVEERGIYRQNYCGCKFSMKIPGG